MELRPDVRSPGELVEDSRNVAANAGICAREPLHLLSGISHVQCCTAQGWLVAHDAAYVFLLFVDDDLYAVGRNGFLEEMQDVKTCNACAENANA